MSNFTNAKPQRKYRERSQPAKREHFGLLEKHQDYKKRATNYHRKKDQLAKLQLKAALKNKEEFNFRMIKGKLKDGQHIEYVDDNEKDEDEGILLNQIKSQNQNLLKAAIHQKEKQCDKLKEDLCMVQFVEPTHKYFINTNRKKSFDLMEEKLKKDDIISQPNVLVSQKLQKLQHNLYETERLKKFLVAVGKSKIKDKQQPHLKKAIKKNKQKGLFERHT